MATENYEIVGSFNNQRVLSLDGERSVNLFEYIDPLTKKNKSLLSTSGLENTDSNFLGATGGFRGQFVFQTNQYVVIGSSVIRITPSGSISILGTLIATSTGYVGIDANTFQVIFVDGANGYIWDTTASVFEKIVDASFPTAPIDVCYLDGFFVVANGNTNTFQLSMFNQGMIWGPATNSFSANSVTNLLTIGASTIGGVSGTQNYPTGTAVVVLNGTGSVPTPLVSGNTYYSILIDATTIKLALSAANAFLGVPLILTGNGSSTPTITNSGQLQQGAINSHPGTIVACRTLHSRLFLFSQFFTEIWENSGLGTNLPFRRNNSILMEYGTPAIGSISVSFDKMIFLSQDRGGLGSIMEVEGTQSIPISNRALDFKLAGYAALSQISDCRGFLLKENGLIFYRMNFTAANHTYVYNVTLSDPSLEEGKLWHEEETLAGNRHPAQTHAYFNGVNYVGHYSKPILYILDSTVFTNDGEAIPRRRIGRPIVPAAYQRTRVDRFQIDLLQGNIALLNFQEQQLSLLTENSFEIDSESGSVLQLEQEIFITAQQDPEVFLSISKDGGQTYGFMMSAPMGEVGDRTFRTVWRKLGVIPRGQAFVPKLEYFINAPFILMGAAWAYEILPE